MSDQYVRIATVTGATSGIGEATVRKFVAAGFGVVGNGRNAVKLAALENEIRSNLLKAGGPAPWVGWPTPAIRRGSRP